jgi:threonine/homoserine/homoserine lactone efflux protein
MDIATALLSFSIAAGLMTLTPGIDTALVLRTAAVENARNALFAALGVVIGVLAWGLLAALGLGAVLAVSEIAYRTLQLAGAAYLIWLGARMLYAAGRGSRTDWADTDTADETARRPAKDGPRWFVRGLTTNLLNPKVGVFYVSFLPQFMPAEVNVVAFSALLAGIHAALSLAWFVLLTLATRPFARALARPATTRALDGITGSVLVGFGLRLALSPHGR